MARFEGYQLESAWPPQRHNATTPQRHNAITALSTLTPNNKSLFDLTEIALYDIQHKSIS